AISLVLLCIFVAGCATDGASLPSFGCTVFKPITYSRKGDTRETVEKLHRIDPNTVKADFKRAGFVLVGSSDILRNPADGHSLLVFDPKIRGKTDRFIFKFKKPR
ncbi:MAG: hypothetical protein V4502_02140, partial [Pseudomonadota bacterium]